MTTEAVTKPTLLVCHVDERGELFHPCAKANAALRDAGVDYDKRVYDKGRPFGIGVKRPELKEISGQEKLPVLQLPEGGAIAGSRAIVDWAKAQGS